MVIARASGLTSVSATLQSLFGGSSNTFRQRLREWYWEPAAKKGAHRRGVDVSACFGDLLAWVVSAWSGEERRLALVLDATSLKSQFVVLAISVVYRGSAIPVAWEVVPAEQPGAWKPVWLRLLRQLNGTLPSDWQVLVLADRGLYADWLFRAIQRLGWHPFLRIHTVGKYRRLRSSQWVWLSSLTPHPGCQWQGAVVCFKSHPVRASLLVRWEADYREAWVILTDLPPEQADAVWYRLRSWIEVGFHYTKRGGWQWQATRMHDPQRASRLWLVMAVATLWVVQVGGEADQTLPASSFEALPPTHIARRLAKSKAHPRPRLRACFRRGLEIIVAALIRQDPLPLGRFYPEPWPSLKTYP